MPTLTLVANDVEIACLGGQVQLEVTATGGDGQYNYIWTDANGTNVGNSAITTVIGAGDATYTVVVNDNCGQQTSTQMNVNAPDPLTLDLPSMVAACGEHRCDYSGRTKGAAVTIPTSGSLREKLPRR